MDSVAARSPKAGHYDSGVDELKVATAADHLQTGGEALSNLSENKMLLRRPHDIAGLVRDGRGRRGWSQSDLAARVGVSRQWISLVENGKTSVELDLVVGTLQALGYDLYVESRDEAPLTAPRRIHGSVTLPTHGPSGRTRLTRGGELLGAQRTRRRPASSDREGS